MSLSEFNSTSVTRDVLNLGYRAILPVSEKASSVPSGVLEKSYLQYFHTHCCIEFPECMYFRFSECIAFFRMLVQLVVLLFSYKHSSTAATWLHSWLSFLLSPCSMLSPSALHLSSRNNSNLLLVDSRRPNFACLSWRRDAYMDVQSFFVKLFLSLG
jgi:hypothetical protein